MKNNLLVLFLSWFFVKTPLQILRLGRDFLRWGWKYFSIGYFLPRLLAPWHRDLTPYGRGFDLQRFLHIFGWNLISRFIGAILRVVVIFVGVLAEGAIAVVAAAAFILWFCLPALSVFLIILGFINLVVVPR